MWPGKYLRNKLEPRKFSIWKQYSFMAIPQLRKKCWKAKDMNSLLDSLSGQKKSSAIENQLVSPMFWIKTPKTYFLRVRVNGSRLALTECEAKFSRLVIPKVSEIPDWWYPYLNSRSQSKITLEENKCIVDIELHWQFQMSFTTLDTKKK